MLVCAFLGNTFEAFFLEEGWGLEMGIWRLEMGDGSGLSSGGEVTSGSGREEWQCQYLFDLILSPLWAE